MRYLNTLLEEELKNRVGEDFFADFNHSTIKGRVDFCIADKQTFMGEPIEYLWAEAKRGKANLDHALVQLILTIGRAQLHTKQSPPHYLGAFDAMRIYFIPFHKQGKSISFLKSEIDEWLCQGKKKSLLDLQHEAEEFVNRKHKRV